jgi:hypothetical protein
VVLETAGGYSSPHGRRHSACRIGGEENLDMARVRLYCGERSRRSLLRDFAYAAASVALVSAADKSFAAKPKKSQADVAYQNFPHGVERCEICAPFLPPDQCRTVAGPVSRQGWCKIYTGA